MNDVNVDTRPTGLLIPGLLLILVLSVGLTHPAALGATVIGVLILTLGLLSPINTVAAVVILIPIIDQLISGKDYVSLFGTFRLTAATAIKGLLILVVVVRFFVDGINPLRIPVLRRLTVYLGYLLFTCVLFEDVLYAFSLWLRIAYWTLLFMFFYVVGLRSGVNQTQVLRLWKAGMISLAILAVSVEASRYWGVGGEFYGVGESYGFFEDPWALALSLPAGLAMPLLYPLVVKGRRRTYVICFALALLTVIASFHTYTRTSLVSCLAVGVFFVLSLIRFQIRRSAAIALLGMSIAMALGGYLLFQIKSGEGALTQRWADLDSDQVASGRVAVYVAGWTRFETSDWSGKLLGHGLGAGAQTTETLLGISDTPLHNDFLEMAVSSGLIGLSIYAWNFIGLYKESFSGLARRSFWGIAALLGVIAYSLTSMTYMRLYAVTPNTYFALIAGTSLGVLRATTRDKGKKVPLSS